MVNSIKPPRLNRGDTIGIAAPASCFKKDDFLHGLSHIREAGYKTFFLPDIFSEENYLAGTDSRRAMELVTLFADRRIRAIFCARGGYGSMRILPLLDPEVIKTNPKIFMGYSDITALHAYLNKFYGLVTFHGPFVTEIGGLSDGAFEYLFQALGRSQSSGEFPCDSIEIIREGNAEGAITGGNLSVFTNLLGTPYEPDTGGKILFFEDRGEKPYQVDRLITHLKLAGKFDGAAGVIVGRFIPPPGWEDRVVEYSREIKRIVLDLLGDFEFPIAANFPAGHYNGHICFPMGAPVRMDSGLKAVTVVEPCVS